MSRNVDPFCFLESTLVNHWGGSFTYLPRNSITTVLGAGNVLILPLVVHNSCFHKFCSCKIGQEALGKKAQKITKVLVPRGGTPTSRGSKGPVEPADRYETSAEEKTPWLLASQVTNLVIPQGVGLLLCVDGRGDIWHSGNPLGCLWVSFPKFG